MIDQSRSEQSKEQFIIGRNVQVDKNIVLIGSFGYISNFKFKI